MELLKTLKEKQKEKENTKKAYSTVNTQTKTTKKSNQLINFDQEK